MKDVYDILRLVRQRPHEQFALATLGRSEGSSYRRPGARMLICRDGLTIGSLSGGCLEEEVALVARDVLVSGEPRLLHFDTRKRFGCDGKIDIFIERVAADFFAKAERDLAARRKTILRNADFEQEIHPPIRLFISGEGPDNNALHSLGGTLGWQTIAADQTMLILPDEWTAAVVKSHNYARDFAALQRLLPMNLRYVGLMGPRKRRDHLLNDLLDLGVTINAGFFSPAGVDLGGETPEEIALEIISEIQRVFGNGSGFSLRERKLPIHAERCKISAR